MASYHDPMITRIIQILNAEGPSQLKNRYYYGDPLMVAKAMLPAVFITKDKTMIRSASTAEDELRMPMVINVVMDLTSDFNKAFNDTQSANTLYELVEGRDNHYQLKPTSIAYILRKYQQLDNQLWIDANTTLELDYGIGVQKRGPGIYTVESVIRLNVLHHQLRPGINDTTRVAESGDVRILE